MASTRCGFDRKKSGMSAEADATAEVPFGQQGSDEDEQEPGVVGKVDRACDLGHSGG